jgi:hypothetical protein
MNTIIAGRFEQQQGAERAVNALADTGFPRDRIVTFFVNSAGQHDVHGTPGDPDASAGAHHAGAGAVAGAAAGTGVGMVVGLATLPVLGPAAPLAGAAIGAYVGSFAGALENLGSPAVGPETRVEPEPCQEEAIPRKSGLLVAVDAPSPLEQASAISVLRAQGAKDLERSHGSIAQSRWDDFDPLSTPSFVVGA